MATKKQDKNKETKFCPECGGENIGMGGIIGVPLTDYCQDCGFNNSNREVPQIIQFPIKQKIKKK